MEEEEEPASEQDQVRSSSSTQSGSFHAKEQHVLEIPEEHSVETDALLSLSDEAYELPSAHLSSSAWELKTLDEPTIRHWDRVNERAQERRGARAGHLWLWLAVLLMGGAVFASLVHTDVWSQVQRQFHAWFPLYQEDLALEPELLSETARSPWCSRRESWSRQCRRVTRHNPEVPWRAKGTGRPRRPRAATQEARAGAALVPKMVAEDAAPHVTVSGEQLILTIPFHGSLQEAVHYPLAQPEGLVVNLPHGKALAPLGNYPVKQGKFRLVWIRKREDGIHIRVFFKGQQVPFKLELLPGSIQVKIKA